MTDTRHLGQVPDQDVPHHRGDTGHPSHVELRYTRMQYLGKEEEIQSRVAIVDSSLSRILEKKR